MPLYCFFFGFVLLLGGCTSTPAPLLPLEPQPIPIVPLAPPQAAAPNFQHAKGRFQVYFPGTPQRLDDQRQVDIGTVALVQYCYQATPYVLWSVSYADYPTALLRLGSSKRLLEGVYQRLLNELHARPLGEPHWGDRSNGAELWFSAALPRQQGQAHYYLLLQDQRLYQVGLQAAGGPIGQQDSLDLFGSFGLLKAS